MPLLLSQVMNWRSLSLFFFIFLVVNEIEKESKEAKLEQNVKDTNFSERNIPEDVSSSDGDADTSQLSETDDRFITELMCTSGGYFYNLEMSKAKI